MQEQQAPTTVESVQNTAYKGIATLQNTITVMGNELTKLILEKQELNMKIKEMQKVQDAQQAQQNKAKEIEFPQGKNKK